MHLATAFSLTLPSTRAPERASMFLTHAFDGSAYAPIRRIGGGAMGDVWEVRHRELGTHFAAKIIGIHLAEDARYIERLRAEAQALSKLNHPHLVRVTDLARAQDGRWFFVMELLRGQDLAERLGERTRLPVEAAVGIALQVLAGLGAAHALGIVHRDVKPANVFLCEPDADRPSDAPLVKLVDFGVAKHAPADGRGEAVPGIGPTATGVVVGTPRYMAPEQCAAKAVDHRADLYAVGLLLYRMLCGRTPFDEHEGVVSLMRAHIRQPPLPPSSYRSELPSLLDAIVLRSLAKLPENRYPNAAELAAALRPLACAEEVGSAYELPGLPGRTASTPGPSTVAESPAGLRRAGPQVTEKMSDALELHRPHRTVPIPLAHAVTEKMSGPLELRHKKTVPLPALPDLPDSAGRVETTERLAEAAAPTRRRGPAERTATLRAVLILVAFAAAILLLVLRSQGCGAT
jgi:eukaryotic-like serine/threonine-protein kinase